MSEVVGEAVIVVRTDETGVDFDKSGKAAGGAYSRGFGASLKGIAVSLGAVLAAKKAVDFTRSAIAASSDLGESASKVSVVFGDQADAIVRASETSATAMGLTKSAYLAATGGLGNLLVSLDLAPKKAAAMSQEMVKLAGDLASFNNVSPEEALQALQSGLTGEAEPLKRFGVNMNDATLKAEALKQGLIKSTKEALDPQTKALAAQSLIMAQTKTAQGDFARTSGGLANQQRILAAQTGDLSAKFGGFLLPIVTKIVTFVNTSMVPALGALGPIFGQVRDGIESAFTAATGQTIGQVVDRVRQLAHDALPALQDAFTAVRPVLIQLGKIALERFRQIVDFVTGSLVPAVEDVATVLRPLVEQAADLIVNTLLPALNQVSGVLLDNIGPALTAITGFLASNATTVQALVVAVVAMVAVWKTYTLIMAAVKVATAAYAAVQTVLNVVLAANPIGIIVIALAGLAAGLIYAYKNSDKFREIVDKTFRVIKEVVVGAIDFVVGFVKDHWPLLLAIITGPLGLIVLAVVKNLDKIKGAFHTVVDAVKQAAKDFIDAVLFIPRKIIELDKKFLQAGVKLIKAFLKGLGAAAGFAADFADQIWEAVKSAINAGIDQLNSLLEFDIKVRGVGISVNAPDIGHLATGTSNWRGGPTWVGEQGPELVNLPRGSQVLTAPQSAAVAGGLSVNIGTLMPHDYNDFQRQMLDQSRMAAIGGRRPLT